MYSIGKFFIQMRQKKKICISGFSSEKIRNGGSALFFSCF